MLLSRGNRARLCLFVSCLDLIWHVSVLQKCDIAIASAAASRKRESQEESDYYFEMAIRALHDYNLNFHLRWVDALKRSKAVSLSLWR